MPISRTVQPTETEWNGRAKIVRSTAVALAVAPDPKAQLDQLLRQIASFDGFRVGQAYTVDRFEQRLTWSAAWHTGSPELQAFVDRSRSLDSSELRTLPAMALRLRKTSIRNAPALEAPRRPEAEAAGLLAGVAIPVVSNGSIVAVLEFHRVERISADDGALLLAEAMAAHLGSVVALRSAEAERERLAEAERERLEEERERLEEERERLEEERERLEDEGERQKAETTHHRDDAALRIILSDHQAQMPTRTIVQTCVAMLRTCLRADAVAAYGIRGRFAPAERLALARVSEAVGLPADDIATAERLGRQPGESVQWDRLKVESPQGRRPWSALSIPLLVEGERVGVLIAFHRVPIPISPYVRRVFQIAADRIAPHVSRAQVIEEAWRDRVRLEELSRRIVSAQESERKAISRDLHDEVGQVITALKYSLESAGSRPEALRAAMSRLMQQVRDLSQRFRPPLLDDMGLVPALEWHLKQVTQQTGVVVRFRTVGACGRYHTDKEVVLFRIVQEALTNVARHSNAKKARVLLRVGKNHLSIRVSDRGLGFDPADIPLTSTGITGMRERLRPLQGQFTIRSRRGRGTEVTANVPILDHEVGMSEPITVVVADDHKIVREALRALLESASFQAVGEASDGLEAVNAVERLKPHVLLLDVSMPGLGGVDVVRQVAKRSPGTKVLMLSMYANDAYVNGAMKNGAAGYVLKDAGASELFHAIREVAQGRRYLSPPLEESGVADRDLTDSYDTLTMREREVLHLAAEGLTSAQIADRLSISPRTAETHRANSLRKLNIRGQTELVRYAIGRGILPAPA